MEYLLTFIITKNSELILIVPDGYCTNFSSFDFYNLDYYF